MIKNILNNKKSLALGLSLSLAFVACDDSPTESSENTDYDRAAMLTDLADNLIIPNFEELKGSVDVLAQASEAFIQNITTENLTELRNAWQESVKDHQHCSAFGFGPGSLLLGSYATVLGVFPVDESGIEANIINPSFDLANSFDRDVRGFYAVEYLIYGTGASDQDLINAFDQNRKDYLATLVTELKTNFDAIVAQWNDSYRASFIASDGTSAGSSISTLYNSFVKDYENLKNFKLELPAGLSAGQTLAEPELLEAYYSGISSELIHEHWESSKNIWYGMSKSGTDIQGFEEYLETVVGGDELIATTKNAISNIDTGVDALPQGDLSESLDDASIVELRDLLQSNTANFKSSMSSMLGISITYNSGDGD